MVIFKVNAHGIFSLPLKRNAPRTVDMHAVALGFSMQKAKVKAGDVQRFTGGYGDAGFPGWGTTFFVGVVFVAGKAGGTATGAAAIRRV